MDVTASRTVRVSGKYLCFRCFYYRYGDLMMSKHAEDMGDTLLKLIDKLAGKGSDIKLSFQDLTIEMGMVKTKINGSIVLDVLYVQETPKK
jgi:hypothetical protein